MLHPCQNYETCKGFAAGHDRKCIECLEADKRNEHASDWRAVGWDRYADNKSAQQGHKGKKGK